jgi:hypothetical protein
VFQQVGLALAPPHAGQRDDLGPSPFGRCVTVASTPAAFAAAMISSVVMPPA